VPIVREADGLALSSRNVRLTPDQRAAAPILYRALTFGKMAWEGGERSPETLRLMMRELFYDEPLARVDYISVADPMTLVELEAPAERALLSMAVYFGDVRLIDNVVVT
jgi:pantoate--beta-alanine ligase